MSLLCKQKISRIGEDGDGGLFSIHPLISPLTGLLARPLAHPLASLGNPAQRVLRGNTAIFPLRRVLSLTPRDQLYFQISVSSRCSVCFGKVRDRGSVTAGS